MQGKIMLDWTYGKDDDGNEQWEAFDRGQAVQLTITHIGEPEYMLEMASGPMDSTYHENIGSYSSLAKAQAAAVEYIEKLDGDDFLAHGTSSARENEAVAGAHGGE